jgi:hypothetical protein
LEGRRGNPPDPNPERTVSEHLDRHPSMSTGRRAAPPPVAARTAER